MNKKIHRRKYNAIEPFFAHIRVTRHSDHIYLSENWVNSILKKIATCIIFSVPTLMIIWPKLATSMLVIFLFSILMIICIGIFSSLKLLGDRRLTIGPFKCELVYRDHSDGMTRAIALEDPVFKLVRCQRASSDSIDITDHPYESVLVVFDNHVEIVICTSMYSTPSHLASVINDISILIGRDRCISDYNVAVFDGNKTQYLSIVPSMAIRKRAIVSATRSELKFADPLTVCRTWLFVFIALSVAVCACLWLNGVMSLFSLLSTILISLLVSIVLSDEVVFIPERRVVIYNVLGITVKSVAADSIVAIVICDIDDEGVRHYQVYLKMNDGRKFSVSCHESERSGLAIGRILSLYLIRPIVGCPS